MSKYVITGKLENESGYSVTYNTSRTGGTLTIDYSRAFGHMDIDVRDLVIHRDAIKDLIKKKEAHDAELQEIEKKLKQDIDRLEAQIKALGEGGKNAS